MKNLAQIKIEARRKSTPELVSPSQWANAMNWNIAAWKCYLSGQKWAHDFKIVCKDQYMMLLTQDGRSILGSDENVQFLPTPANIQWANELTSQIAEMQMKGEWNEALRWSKIQKMILGNASVKPNQKAFKKEKKAVKGHQLIRINQAA